MKLIGIGDGRGQQFLQLDDYNEEEGRYQVVSVIDGNTVVRLTNPRGLLKILQEREDELT